MRQNSGRILDAMSTIPRVVNWALFDCSRDVHLVMAIDAQCDQVFFRIVAGMTAKLFVMDFQV